MNILYLVAHPRLESSVVNATFTRVAEKLRDSTQDQVRVRDLYALYPNYQINVELEQAQLVWADQIVFQFPFYWYNMPPLLKKWMDDVLTYGFAFGDPEKMQLKGKSVLASISAGGPAEAYQPTGWNRFTVEEFLRPLEQTTALCGMKWEKPHLFYGAVSPQASEVQSSAQELMTRLQNKGGLGRADSSQSV